MKKYFKGKPALIICGSDETGLMYGLLDVGKRISWSKEDEDLFRYVINQWESPSFPDRSVSIYARH